MTRPMGRLSACKSCAAPIVFARLDTGRLIPLNPLPNPAGNVAVFRAAAGRNLTAYVLSKTHPLEAGFVRAMPHAATCEAKPSKPKAPEPEALF